MAAGPPNPPPPPSSARLVWRFQRTKGKVSSGHVSGMEEEEVLQRKYLEILQKFGYEGTTIFCEKNCNNKGYAVHIVKLPRHPTVFLTKLSGFAKSLFFVVESAEKTRRWGNIPPSYYYKTVYSLLLLIRQYESDLAPGNSQSDDSSSTRGG